jgi:hypothetical protein
MQTVRFSFRSFGSALVLLLAFSSCTTVKKDFKPLSDAEAARIAPYAMMAANSYHGTESFPLKSLGWIQIDRAGNETGEPTYSHGFSLAFDIFRNDRLRQYAFVYRGTDSLLDFPWANLAPLVSKEYLAADWYFRKFLSNRLKPYQNYEIVLVGHSLGGGMALRESVLLGFDAFVFDPSPRLFGPPIPRYKPAKRVAVFEKGEILSIIRGPTTSWYKAMNTVYQTEFPFPDAERKHGVARWVSLHSMPQLAEGIRVKGVRENPTLEKAALRKRSESRKPLPTR